MIKRFMKPRKGKDMTVVRLASYLNSEKHFESLYATKHEEWSGLSCSYKIKPIENLTIV